MSEQCLMDNFLNHLYLEAMEQQIKLSIIFTYVQ